MKSKPTLNAEAVGRQIAYYQQWYNDMDKKERKSRTGAWILERISMYAEAINDEVRELRKAA
jgi:hypothetical protein